MTETLAGEKRDDSGLRSLICPHCQQTIRVVHIRAFEKQQLIWMRCEICGEVITKQQIDDTYREYVDQ